MGLWNAINLDFVATSVMDTDVSLVANTDAKISTQRAVKAYVDAVNTNMTQLYKSGVLKTPVRMYTGSATVSSGNAIFYLTDDGTSGGNAIFNNVYQESFNWTINDATNSFQVGSYTLAGNKKSITVAVNRIGLSLGLIIFTSAANGTTVYFTVWGD